LAYLLFAAAVPKNGEMGMSGGIKMAASDEPPPDPPPDDDDEDDA
jgi:hypothetical protein